VVFEEWDTKKRVVVVVVVVVMVENLGVDVSP